MRDRGKNQKALGTCEIHGEDQEMFTEKEVSELGGGEKQRSDGHEHQDNGRFCERTRKGHRNHLRNWRLMEGHALVDKNFNKKSVTCGALLPKQRHQALLDEGSGN